MLYISILDEQTDGQFSVDEGRDDTYYDDGGFVAASAVTPDCGTVCSAHGGTGTTPGLCNHRQDELARQMSRLHGSADHEKPVTTRWDGV